MPQQDRPLRVPTCTDILVQTYRTRIKDKRLVSTKPFKCKSLTSGPGEKSVANMEKVALLAHWQIPFKQHEPFLYLATTTKTLLSERAVVLSPLRFVSSLILSQPLYCHRLQASHCLRQHADFHCYRFLNKLCHNLGQ